MVGRRFVLVIFVALGGCYPPPPVYAVQRSARVPRPTVPLQTGQPLSGPVEVSFGTSATGSTPEAGNRGSAPMKALEIPKHQVRGEVRFRLFERGQLAVIHERAIGAATKIDETQADVDSGQPWSIGGAARYSINPNRAPWSVGLDFELMRWQVPYTEVRTCIENCDGVDSFQETHSASSEMTWGFGVTPAYRVHENVSLFGGAFFRNHPTINRKGTELTEHNDEDTEAGPPNLLLHAGVAFRYENVSALVLVSQNTDRDPVRYGPSVGFALSVAFPESWHPASKPSKIDEARERMRRANARRSATRD